MTSERLPFRFSSRTHLTELTGIKASTLRELTEVLRTAPDAVVYYHTHHFFQEHLFLRQVPPNDFAYWAGAALFDEVIAETLAAVNIMDFASLPALRDRFVSILDEYLSVRKEVRTVPEGMEFHFMKSIAAIMPTPYVATNLREFLEVVRQVSTGSIYYHFIEARLRLGHPQNDFSLWLRDSLGERELAEQVGRLDPYMYTLEGLRSALIQLLERRLR